MIEAYNPIVREFGRLRAGIVRATGVPRGAVRPGTKLEELFPRTGRREVWQRVRADGRPLPGLALPRDFGPGFAVAIFVAAGAFAVAIQSWYGLLAVVPFGWLACRLSRPWAVEFPLGLRTVGELTVYRMRFADHRGSGYRWTPNEVRWKVRMIVAETAGVPIDEVRSGSRFVEDLGLD